MNDLTRIFVSALAGIRLEATRGIEAVASKAGDDRRVGAHRCDRRQGSARKISQSAMSTDGTTRWPFVFRIANKIILELPGMTHGH
jgi:hypothetical protein